MPSIESFTTRVERLAEDKDWTFEDVAQRIGAMGRTGASRSSVIQAKRDSRKLNRTIIESAAEVLDISPGEFAEWRPIVIRDSLRLDNGNLSQVTENLRLVESMPSDEALAAMPAAPRRRGDATEDYLRALEAAAQQRAELREDTPSGDSPEHRQDEAL